MAEYNTEKDVEVANDLNLKYDVTLETDDDGRFPRRTGDLNSSIAHIITAVIGSGVLSLGWSVAQVGWVFGPALLVLFSVLTLYVAHLLCDAYRIGGTGPRNITYFKAVQAHFGKKNQVFCLIVQMAAMITTGIGYTVTGSLSVVAAKRALCFHRHRDLDHHEAPCSFQNTLWMVMFGGINICFSQIPNFGNLWWLSYIAATTSFGYSFIGLGLSIGKATENGHADYGTALGQSVRLSEAAAVFNIFTAMGSIAFAYSYCLLLIEIQDTISEKFDSAQVMKKATTIGIFTTAMFYLAIACISYAGFGNAQPGNLVTGFGFFNPFWLVFIANIFVFIHLIGGYQVYMQPVMDALEQFLLAMFPDNRLMRMERELNVPLIDKFLLSPFKLSTRTLLVAFTTVLACLLPFFNAIVSLMGAISFFPLTVYFPIQMYMYRVQLPQRSAKAIFLNGLCFVALLISIAASIGSVRSIIDSVKGYKPFNSVSSGIST